MYTNCKLIKSYTSYQMSVFILQCCCLVMITQVSLIETLSVSSKPVNNQLLSATSQNQDLSKFKLVDRRHEKSSKNRANSQQVDMRDLHPTTSLPPLLMTTMSQYSNFIDSLAPTSKNSKTSNNNNNLNKINRRSSRDNQMVSENLSEDLDSDANPLQTVNNHSGGSNNRASQYVDISNLVPVS